MLLTPQELLAAARRLRDYSDLMLELSGFTGGRIPRFLRPEQIKQIRESAGMAPASETPAERAWRHYQEIADAIARQLAHVNRAIERALKRSEKRVQAAEEALERIGERATIDSKGRRVYRTANGQRGFTDDGHVSAVS
jgi:hypothetical protein